MAILGWSVEKTADPFWQYKMRSESLWVQCHVDEYQQAFLGPVRQRMTCYTVWKKGHWIGDNLGWKLIEDSSDAVFNLPSFPTVDELLASALVFIETKHLSPAEQLALSVGEVEFNDAG